MRKRSRFLVAIVSVIIMILVAVISGGHSALVTASSNTASPSQFYLQHNLISDGFVAADHIDTNQGNPTGVVFNGGTGFVVNNGVGAPAPARFIFASEDGTLSAFKGAPIVTVVPNAQAPAHGAIYKGLAIDSATAGQFLYATDFHNAKVDIFDSSFHAVTIPGSFTDPNLPAGFAPFGIQNINGTIYVTYALQDENKEDDVAGPG